MAALHSALKGSGRGRDGRRTFRPEREALQFPAEGGAAGGVLQDGVEQGDGAGMKFGRRPEDMDDETRVAEIKQLRVRGHAVYLAAGTTMHAEWAELQYSTFFSSCYMLCCGSLSASA